MTKSQCNGTWDPGSEEKNEHGKLSSENHDSLAVWWQCELPALGPGAVSIGGLSEGAGSSAGREVGEPQVCATHKRFQDYSFHYTACECTLEPSCSRRYQEVLPGSLSKYRVYCS